MGVRVTIYLYNLKEISGGNVFLHIKVCNIIVKNIYIIQIKKETKKFYIRLTKKNSIIKNEEKNSKH